MEQQTIESTPIARLEFTIEQKRKQTKNLNTAINNYVSLKLIYTQKSNEALLTTNFKEVLNESRPTVAMKEAYIENLLFDEKMDLNIAKENIGCIKRDIEILDDEIRLYEYQIQMEMKE